MSERLPNMLEFSHAELGEFMADLGQPRYRANQVWQWLWQKGAESVAEMTNLSKDLRAHLEERARIAPPVLVQERVSRDGTAKFLLEMEDGARIETVLIPAEDHVTQCLSTQVGCAMACEFCATGRMGFSRNMTQAEILGQVLMARRWLAEQEYAPLRNLVFMGMGEPMNNYTNLLRSLEALRHPLGLDFSARRITVSSVGVERNLHELGESGHASLAISLHAPTQELRERIMPRAAQALPLDRLLHVLDTYPLKARQRITYEYVLLRGVNDRPEHARELAKLLGQRKAKVNLIAYNPGPDDPFQAPGEEDILTFQKVLWDKNITVILRKSMGADIQAACGQLITASEGPAA